MKKKHDKALTATWYEGRDVGYQEGHHDGFEEGEAEGYRSGLSQIDGYQQGYAQHARDARDAKEA